VARQLLLELPHRPALGREDFLVSDANAAAAALIDAWPNWPSPTTVLVGPAGSGKTHLSEVWRLKSGAERHDAIAKLPTEGEAFARLIENMPNTIDDATLFHLINLAREQGGSILMTSRTSPATWNIALPDLASRLKAASVVAIGTPDDTLLRAVLVKHFADRQLAIDDSLIGYLAARMPRSLAAARTIVAEIDRAALETRAEITKPFVAAVLKQLSEPKLFGGFS
jgi:chromosomal replication initiation ATPase DnaA